MPVQYVGPYSPAAYAAANSGQTTPYSPGVLSGANAIRAAQPAVIGGGGTGSGGVNPAIAQFDQGIGNTQSALNRLNPQLEQGYSGIDNSYNNALNQLLLGKNQANQAYTTNKQQTATDFVGAKNTIGANAGSSLNSLLRLLGSRGAGGGSAYGQVAPEAVARGATLQRQDVTGTFGKNNQSLDTGWGNYMTDYNNQVSGAGSQREQQRQGLNSQIEQSRGSLLQALAGLQGQRAQAAGGNAVGAAQPYLDQANQALDRATSYRAAPIAFQTQAYKAPELGAYTTNPNAAPTTQGQRSASDYFSPYLSALLGKRQLAGV